MNNPFGGGYSIATIVYPEHDRVRILFGAVPYQHNAALGKVYEWEFATVRNGGVTTLASIAEMAQIARFIDNGGGNGVNSAKGALSSLKAYIYFAALVYKQAQEQASMIAAA